MRTTWLLVVAVCAGAGCHGHPLLDKLASLRRAAPPPPPAMPLPPPPAMDVQLDLGTAGGRAPEPAREPARRSSTVYARFQGAGDKWLCEAHPDADACQRSCNARFELALKMGAGTSCSCTTERRCDQMVDP